MDSFNPGLWGPHAWIYLHSITLSYPNKPTADDKEAMKQFFNSLRMPCQRCQQSYDDIVDVCQITDKDLACKKNLVAWLIKVRNKINAEIGVKPIDKEELLKNYLEFYESPGTNAQKSGIVEPALEINNIDNYVLLFIIVLLLLYIVFRNQILQLAI